MGKKKKRDWQCFQCGFIGTDKEVLDHKCPGFKPIKLPNGENIIVRR